MQWRQSATHAVQCGSWDKPARCSCSPPVGASITPQQEEARAAQLRAAVQAARAEELQAALEGQRRGREGRGRHRMLLLVMPTVACLPRSVQDHALRIPVHPRRREMQRQQAERGDGANFLLACLADVRQELLAHQGRAELAQLPPPARSGAAADQGDADGPGSPGSAAPAPPLAALGELPQAQREAALLRLLEQLGVDWQAREGLLLPSSGSRRPAQPDAAPAAPAPVAGAAEGSATAAGAAPACGSPGPASSRGGCVRSSSTRSAGARSMCSKSELLELVMSPVREWGGRSLSSGGAAAPAASPPRRLATIPSRGSQ